ncbi:protein binding protein [[Candida] boidinii]|nr:protein binding protein [[Candida] boidinii]
MNQELYNRLGARGREIYEQLQQQQQVVSERQGQSGFSSEPLRLPTQLDYLLEELINPYVKKTDLTQIERGNQLLSYIANYYPKLKNEKNVELLTEYFLRCPVFFSNDANVPFALSNRILECFRYIFDKKYKTSMPVLKFYKFYHAALTGILNFIKLDPTTHFWKVIPVISGILSTINYRDQYDPFPEYSNVIKKIDKQLATILETSFIQFFTSPLVSNDNLRSVNILCLSLTYGILNKSFLPQLLNKHGLLLTDICGLMFISPFGLQMTNFLKIENSESESSQKIDKVQSIMTERPLLRYLNSLSFLFKEIVLTKDYNTDIKLDQIDLCFNKCLIFAETLSANTDLYYSSSDKLDLKLLDLYRQILFAKVVMFESIVQWLLESNNSLLLQDVLPRYSRKVINIFYHISFILDYIGTGGFESYNFVFSSCLDAILQYRMYDAEILANVFTTGINFCRLKESYVFRSKLLFTLNYFEQFVNICSDSIRHCLILPLIEDITASSLLNKGLNINFNDPADLAKFKDIVEASHSIMLKFLTIQDSYDENLISKQQTKSRFWSLSTFFSNGVPPQPTTNIEERPTVYNENLHIIMNKILPYTELSISQFPLLLSTIQLNIIIETLARSIFPNSKIYDIDHELGERFLNILYNNCTDKINKSIIVSLDSHSEEFDNIKSDTQEAFEKNKENSGNGEELSDNVLKTRASCLISSLIGIFPLMPPHIFIKWLNISKNELISPLIRKEEKEFLLNKLWNSIIVCNKYDPQKGNLGINWWYKNINNSKNPILI